MCELLSDMPALISGPGHVVLAEGRHRNVRVDLVIDGATVPVVVKAFGPRGLARELVDRVRGTKAVRSWRAAAFLAGRGVGTPPPVAWMERWERGRLRESYFLTEFQAGITNFRDELLRMPADEENQAGAVALVEVVSDAVRAMHDAGFQHRDLGNQNILLRAVDDGQWGDVQFVDLNRGRIPSRLSERDRARDISRLDMPPELLGLFKRRYWQGAVPPLFERHERLCRFHYAVHSRTRSLRHPGRLV